MRVDPGALQPAPGDFRTLHCPFSMNRREFITGTGLLAASAFLPVGIGLRRRTPSCIIVGAGLAGLAAARLLTAKGWNVTILEARQRLGGRVLSYQVEGDSGPLVCEVGAEWVGASHDRIQALCRQFHLTLSDHRFQSALLQNGRLIPPHAWSYSNEAQQAFEAFRREYATFSEKQRRSLDRVDWWTWLERIGFNQDDLRLRDLFDSTDFGESIRHVSALMAAAEYFESSPANEMDFKIVGGNSRLIEALGNSSGASIRTGLNVSTISQRKGMVTAIAGGEKFTGDACICTVPARALSSIQFDPPLPSQQVEAARSLQYARIIKSSIHFTSRFWGAEDFSVVSDETSHYYFHATKGQKGDDGILTSYAIGDKADVLAARDDARRKAMIVSDLAAIEPRAAEMAREIISFPWQRDTYTRGAYALYGPGQWFGVRPVLSRPHGKILFAGEHLADWQGFMEGAVVTGEEAAASLLD